MTPKETCAETGIANDEAKILPSSHFVVIFVLRFGYYLFCYDATKINTAATPDGQERQPPSVMKSENRENSCGDFEATKCALHASRQLPKRKPRP